MWLSIFLRWFQKLVNAVVLDALHLSSVRRDDDGRCQEKSIVLSLSSEPIHLPGDLDPSHFNMDEAYTLSISAEQNCITITGFQPAGVFYGIVSLISLAHGNLIVLTCLAVWMVTDAETIDNETTH